MSFSVVGYGIPRVEKKKIRIPAILIKVPIKNASRRLKISIMMPAKDDPMSIPRLWAMVISPMSEPMASDWLPLKTAIAIWAGMDIPPPNPNRMLATIRSDKEVARAK